MEVGQICVVKANGNRGEIVSVSSSALKIRWPKTGMSEYTISYIQQLIDEGSIRVYNGLPKDNPNLSFKRRK